MRSFSILVLALLCACNGRPDQPNMDGPGQAMADGETAALVSRLHQRFGHANAVVCDLLMRIEHPDRGRIVLTLSLRSAQDGCLRAWVNKLGYDFLDLIMFKDGRFQAWMVRSHAQISSTLSAVEEAMHKRAEAAASLDDSTSNLLLSAFRMLESAIKNGPLPLNASWQGARLNDGSVRLSGSIDGHKVRCLVDRFGQNVLSKEIYDLAGTKRLLRLEYEGFRDMDGLVRPRLIRAYRQGQDEPISARVRSLDVVPSINEATMDQNIPANTRELDVDTFLDLLAADEEDAPDVEKP